MFLSIILFVLVAVQQYQFQKFNHKVENFNVKVDKVQVSADNSLEASNNINQQITKIINEQINSPEARAATQAGRQRVINIEYFLCKGPCPDAPTTTTTVPK